jgi:hypothetical protein
MLSHSVRVAAGQLADNHATPGAFAYVNMVVGRRPRGDQLKLWMLIEDRCVDPGRDVDTENFSISPTPAKNRRLCSASAALKKASSGCSVSVKSIFMVLGA